MDVPELEPALRPLEGRRPLGVADQHRLVYDLEEAVGRVAGVEREGEQEADRLEREPQHRRGGEEGDERTRRELPLGGQDHADGQAQGERAIRDEGQPAPDERDRAGLLHLGAAQLLRLGLELAQRVRPAAERLEHADAVHRLLDRSGEVAGLVLAAPRGRAVAALEADGHEPDRDRAQQEDRAEQRVDAEEQHGADDDRHRVDDQKDQAEREPAADQVEVVHGARQQLAAGPPVVERDGKRLQVGVERVPHVRLDVRVRRQHEPAPHEDGERFEDPQTHDEERRRKHRGRIPVLEGGVDEDLEDLRDGERDERGHQPGDHAGDEARQRGADEGAEAEQGTDGGQSISVDGHADP
ncbi:hypothetical protein GCM10025866_08560 [Naasia aerilata]|uniref:Uncharacterized protein n=1 Tax=Naasia aerilata TaxID=1162966 RepID=A0ABM8G9S6_9MICO|nr:hypothetical protein GCM10025866_08560 [Naasia aerilata]